MALHDKEQRIISLIENRTESEFVDFKREFYHKNKIYDLIKDVLSFANVLNKEEKFIIFGIDENFNLFNINYEEIRDISSINQLINEYCEPYIKTELIEFSYKGTSLLALGILDNFDHPYVIKKDYNKNSDTSLKKGDIYIRKDATNFRASREDLDKIYSNRNKVEVRVRNDEICFKMIQIGCQREKKCCVPILIDNNTNRSIVVHKGVVIWSYSDNAIGSDIEFLEDNDYKYQKELRKLNDKPFYIQANSQYLKLAIFKMSEQLFKIIKNRQDDELTITIKLLDATNKEICSSSKIKSIIFETE